MNRLIDDLIKKGMGNFMDRNRDALAQADEIYLNDRRDEKELEQRYDNLNLTRGQKKVVNDLWYVHRLLITVTPTYRICAVLGIQSACLYLWD